MTLNPSVQSRLSPEDLYLFNEGTHRSLAGKMGAHFEPGVGTSFSVWAPNARAVCVMGDFNAWNPANLALSPRGTSGIWEGTVAEAERGH
ncbi:MAG: 1,4-alpha-glucan branching enzyme, partial [Acidimicrobiales bacterium]